MTDVEMVSGEEFARRFTASIERAFRVSLTVEDLDAATKLGFLLAESIATLALMRASHVEYVPLTLIENHETVMADLLESVTQL